MAAPSPVLGSSEQPIDMIDLRFCRLFGTKCDKCGDSFHKNDYVMRAKTKIYHVHCFKCSVCSRKLLIGKCCR